MNRDRNLSVLEQVLEPLPPVSQGSQKAFLDEVMSGNFEALLQKYNQSIPRYTSYPPATELKEDFTEVDFQAAIAASNKRQSPLSLYCHIPFCQTACYFCGCNVIVSNHQGAANTYLESLLAEIRQSARLIDVSRPVTQMHWGGGTPNYLNLDQVERLWNGIHHHFNLSEDAELSIEVNPRYIDRNYILSLRQIGFNRISFGIQDFNPEVQAAVNRVQPEELLFNVMDWIREAGFESANVDLIYGLPHQTLETFTDTIQKTIKLNPDRIAVFNFAYVPWLKPVQKNIPEAALPSAAEKLEIFKMTISSLLEHHYHYIGMDHFAREDNELTIAQQEGHLHRNFQGYTTQAGSDLFGFGITSISMLDDAYVQHHKRLKDYYASVEAGRLPVERGVRLNRMDQIRRYIIMQLMCHFKLSKRDVEARYFLDFDEYFFSEELELQALAADGLVKLSQDWIEVTPMGRLLIRNIAAVFDTYLQGRTEGSFSKAL